MLRNRHFASGSHRTSEHGYVLLAMLLFVALLAIAAAAIAPSIAFQVRRDREEELVHRGVQYSRAIKHYWKKFNRYPSKIEDLQSTNNLRFLRKAYKDPITGADFKLIYLSQVQAMGIGAGGGIGPGVAGSASGLAPSASAGNPGAAKTPTAGGDAGDDSASGQTGSDNPNAKVSTDGTTSVETGPASGKVFGGGPIAGVVSTSKAKSIREFNNKDHYNQWLFIYDPTSDRGGLLNTPLQPPLKNAVPPNQAGPPAGLGSASGNQGTLSQPPALSGGMQTQQSPPPQ